MSTRILTFDVPELEAPERLDRYLVRQLAELSRVRIQRLIRDGRVEVSAEKTRKPSYELQGGEQIRVELVAEPPLAAQPEAIPLRVVYEDEDLVVVDKPAGMVVHAGAGVRSGTLVNALLHRFRELSAVGGPQRPGIVHRLDKMTSGLLLAARNDRAHRRLAEQFRRRKVEKTYLALVHGRIARARGEIDLPVSRDRRRRIRMTALGRTGREALTRYRVLERFAAFTLLEATLHTGRTHQIRVHLSALGHPVVGDTLYGAPRNLRLGRETRPTLSRHFLHAARLRFQQPSSGLFVSCEAPLPEELTRLLDEIRRREA